MALGKVADEVLAVAKDQAGSRHLDADDPTHEFLRPEAWAPLPNAKKLASAYNRPFERNFRLRLRRAVAFESIGEIMDPHYEAADALALAAMIRTASDEAHISGDLEYYPDGSAVAGSQVWKRGAYWLKVAI
jgi:hypothetical protein